MEPDQQHEEPNQTTRDFIQNYHITMIVESVDENPHMNASDYAWNRAASHYRCMFRCRKKRFTTYFSMGPAHTREPTAADVLDCLASDSASVENARDFEEWCGDLGYDTDSRRAEKTYNVCQRQAQRLRNFLGQAAYEELLWRTERL